MTTKPALTARTTAQLLTRPYERTHRRLGHRDGSYRRSVVAALAATELSVPRRRQVPGRPSFLVRAARRATFVDDLLRQPFLRGSVPARRRRSRRP